MMSAAESRSATWAPTSAWTLRRRPFGRRPLRLIPRAAATATATKRMTNAPRRRTKAAVSTWAAFSWSLMTTTTEPTTTSEVGCCYGEGVKENEMCGKKESREQCERSGNCEFRSGENADCEYTPTTTTEEIGCCTSDNFKQFDM